MYTVPQNISNVLMTMLNPHLIIICKLEIIIYKCDNSIAYLNAN